MSGTSIYMTPETWPPLSRKMNLHAYHQVPHCGIKELNRSAIVNVRVFPGLGEDADPDERSHNAG